MGPQPPTSTLEWVNARVMGARCPQKLRRTILTGIGSRHRSDQMGTGERVLYGPTGEPIRILGYEHGSVAVEHGDHRHAIIRPRPINYRFGRNDPPQSLLRSIIRTKGN